MNAWLFDLGNSRLKCVPMAGDGALAAQSVQEIAHEGGRFADHAFAALPPAFDMAYVASVAGSALTAALLDALSARCPLVSLVRTQPSCEGVRIAYAQPQRLGVDRFLALLAARSRGAQPWLVVGVGTALTIDLLDAGGVHHGGRIAPSPTLMREALHQRAPHLPASGGAYAEFADDTLPALTSGCDGAALGLIARSRDIAIERIGAPPRLLLHGGGATALLPHLGDVEHAPALVLEGLACWARAMTRPPCSAAAAGMRPA
ncbi:MAG: type III pantothenate kinase [Luteimonas sp.]